MLIGTRLGLLYSWKIKSVLNTKAQMLTLFKKEQAYILVYKFISRINPILKNNHLLLQNPY
jgi:hypothetical protein